MKIEDIIYMLNKHINSEREKLNIDTKGHLVLLKTIIPNKVIKAYKEVEVCLWYVNGKQRNRLITEKLTTRILEGHEEKIMNDIYNDLVLRIFNWMKTEEYNKVIRGVYGNKVEVS